MTQAQACHWSAPLLLTNNFQIKPTFLCIMTSMPVQCGAEMVAALNRYELQAGF